MRVAHVPVEIPLVKNFLQESHPFKREGGFLVRLGHCAHSYYWISCDRSLDDLSRPVQRLIDGRSTSQCFAVIPC
jgi:hypothetical protein